VLRSRYLAGGGALGLSEVSSLSQEDEVGCISSEYLLISTVFPITVPEYPRDIHKFTGISPNIGEAIQPPYSLISR
jgi:hypothetical protein